MSQYFFRYYPSPLSHEEIKLEKKIFWFSQIIPFLVVLLMWLVHLYGYALNVELTRLGIYPMRPEAISGILTMPFIHSDLNHISSNSVSFYVLATSLFFFYRKHATIILTVIYILSGILLWFSGREAWHIGMSGVVYGLAFFQFFSGVLRKDLRLLTIALAVAFMYGSMIWGLFPVKPSISWEGHLSGAVAGVALAIVMRNFGPPRIKYDWEDEDDEEVEGEEENKKEEMANVKYREYEVE